jgi:hypothetical protein
MHVFMHDCKAMNDHKQQLLPAAAPLTLKVLVQQCVEQSWEAKSQAASHEQEHQSKWTHAPKHQADTTVKHSCLYVACNNQTCHTHAFGQATVQHTTQTSHQQNVKYVTTIYNKITLDKVTWCQHTCQVIPELKRSPGCSKS